MATDRIPLLQGLIHACFNYEIPILGVRNRNIWDPKIANSESLLPQRNVLGGSFYLPDMDVGRKIEKGRTFVTV